MNWQSILAAAVLAIAAPAALAQNPQPASPGDPHTSLAPPNAPTPPPEQIAPGARGPATQGNLSDKLSRQQGMLQPPTVDPGINATPPAHGAETMPVIPPPGTPGGNQKVVPK